MREVEAIPAALPRVNRLAIVHLDERCGSDEIRPRVDARHLGRREQDGHIWISIVLPCAQPRLEVLHPAADQQVIDRPNTGATTKVVGANRVIGSVVAIRFRAKTEEVLLRVIAVAAPGLEMQVVVGQSRKRQARLGRPVPLDAAGGPDFNRAFVGKEIAIAEANPVGEAAAGRQRPEFWMNAFAVEEEDRSVFGEVERTLQAVWLVCRRVLSLLFATPPIGLFACLRLLRRRGASKRKTEISGTVQLRGA